MKSLIIALIVGISGCSPVPSGLMASGPTSPSGVSTSGGASHKLGTVIVPQQVGDFWVNQTSVTPFALKDTGGVTRDTFETTHGRIVSGGGGTDWAATFGPVVGFETSRSGVWFLPNGTAASGSNPSIQYISGNGLASQLQNNADLFSWSAPVGTIGAFGTSAWYVDGSTGAAPLQLNFSTATTPFIQSGTSATSLAVGTNKSLATLALQFGAAATALSLDPTNGDAFKDSGGVTRDSIELTHGRFTAGNGGTDRAAIIGPSVGAETSSASLYLLPNATAASANNFQVQSDGTSYVSINAPNGGYTKFLVSASIYGAISSNTGSIGALWLGNIVPSGTNYALQSDGATVTTLGAGTPITQLASGTQNGVALGANLATVGHQRTPAGFEWMSRNNANGANYNVLSTNSSDVLQIGDTATLTQLVMKGGGAPFVSVSPTFVDLSGTDAYLDATTVHLRNASNIETNQIIPGSGVGGAQITNGIAFQDITITGNRTIDTTTGDNVVLVDTSVGVVSVTLPTPTHGRWLTIIDKKNTFGTNNCTIVRHGTEKINNVAASKVLSANGYRGYIWSDGTDWYTE